MFCHLNYIPFILYHIYIYDNNNNNINNKKYILYSYAAIAQLGERQTEDLKVPGSIPGGGIYIYYIIYLLLLLYDNNIIIMPLDH